MRWPKTELSLSQNSSLSKTLKLKIVDRHLTTVRVHKDGTIVHNGRVKNCCDNGRGYKTIILSKTVNGIEYQKRYYVHRIVATAFIPNPESKKQVNHINNERGDNRLENLEWTTRSENISHIWKNHLPMLLGTYLEILRLHYEDRRGMKDISKLTNIKIDMVRNVLEGKYNETPLCSPLEEKGVGVVYGYGSKKKPHIRLKKLIIKRDSKGRYLKGPFYV